MRQSKPPSPVSWTEEEGVEVFLDFFPPFLFMSFFVLFFVVFTPLRDQGARAEFSPRCLIEGTRKRGLEDESGMVGEKGKGKGKLLR